RTALMSGLRPGASGVYDNGTDWRPQVPQAMTLGTQFRNAGYSVVGSGKIYHESYHRAAEWDDYEHGQDSPAAKKSAKGEGVGGIKFAPLDCADSDLADWQIVDYAIKQLNAKHDKPFFLACGV